MLNLTTTIMIVWNAGRLAEDLRAERVPSRDQLVYMLVALVLQTLSGRASLLGAFSSGGGGLRAAFWPVVSLAIAAAGLLACFRANARGGRPRLPRAYCLP